ncbi:unnamed protein product [Symbiodinium sp. CCMP2592]|nr:unnamed protein product [Symbiodinium sp. CCMP2592]
MSKKVVTKKKAQPPRSAAAENGATPVVAPKDVRVAQQLRVLETVAAKGDADEKKYSPRAERYIQQLHGVLDFFEYSRNDIAVLVRKCHYDENQIQIAVANIVEDRSNHGQDQWETVGRKKQTKEKKKAKDEEAEAEVDVKSDHPPGHRQDYVSQEQDEWSTVKNKKQAKEERKLKEEEEKKEHDKKEQFISPKDRTPLEPDEWSTVKNKKQVKEQRKIKEEEEKKEQEKKDQERQLKEEENKRREAERKAAADAREAELAKAREAPVNGVAAPKSLPKAGKGGGGKGAGKNGFHHDTSSASALPPDPAILFAGPKPEQNGDHKEETKPKEKEQEKPKQKEAEKPKEKEVEEKPKEKEPAKEEKDTKDMKDKEVDKEREKIREKDAEKDKEKDKEHWQGGQWWEGSGERWNKSWDWESWREDDGAKPQNGRWEWNKKWNDWDKSQQDSDGWWGNDWKRGRSWSWQRKDKDDARGWQRKEAHGARSDRAETTERPGAPLPSGLGLAMSKKVVTKKKAQPPAATIENGAPPAAAPASNDVRVAQQLRVLETVAAKGDADEKTYSPRTERHIQQLTDVLDFFEYSRNDIAALVRRCHYDEHQIQVAVANIVEDRANHEQEEWGTVKNKKQAKEERKLKEEEDKKEQERLEKEQEKQRREAERKAAKEAREAERAKRGGKGGKNGTEPEMPAASLPPDPAILFAGTKQSSDDQEWQGGGQWWESGGNASWNSKSWEWESWRDDWNSSKGQAEDGWWGGQWEKAGSRRKGYKDKKEPVAEEDDDGEGVLWDMPDTSAQPDGEGGLDQWTLGHLPVHERMMEGEQTLGMPKALPENALTLEELERDHLAAPAAPPVVPAPPMPQASPQVSAPMPNVAPPTTKPLLDSLPPQQDILAALGSQPVVSPGSVPVADDRGDRQDRGEKGRGKGGKKGKGERDRTEGEKERLERIDRSDDPRRQAVEQVGEVVTVRKHSSMGCAVVSMTDVRVRQAIVEEGNECVINGIKVQIKPHTNKETKEEVLTDLFVAWGRQAEKQNPLSEQTIAKYFDTRHKEITGGWKAAEEEKLRAEEQERRQQEQVLRERTEQRRRYEEQQEQLRRQQEASAGTESINRGLWPVL